MYKTIGRAFMDIRGFTTLKLEDEKGEPKEICFACIRCGISWPILNYPGYYCVLGLLRGATAGDADSLLFLREGEKQLLEELTEAVINEARDLRFSEIFTDRMKPELRGFGIHFDKSIRQNNRLADLRLKHSPFADDFHLGRDLIRKWGKNGAIKIPENSILYKHMVNPVGESVLASQEVQLYPINALRYVALAFEKVRPCSRPEKVRIPPFSGWT